MIEQSKSPKSCAYARITIITKVLGSLIQEKIQFPNKSRKIKENQPAISMNKFYNSSNLTKTNTSEN